MNDVKGDCILNKLRLLQTYFERSAAEGGGRKRLPSFSRFLGCGHKSLIDGEMSLLQEHHTFFSLTEDEQRLIFEWLAVADDLALLRFVQVSYEFSFDLASSLISLRLLTGFAPCSSAYRVCKNWSTLVWRSQKIYCIQRRVTGSFRNFALLTNLERLNVAAVVDGAFESIPSFQKLKSLSLPQSVPESCFRPFAETAFGLSTSDLTVGTLRNLRDLTLQCGSFGERQRAPLVRAIVRTCPLLRFLSLPSDSGVPHQSQDIKEYEDLLAAISTLKNLTFLHLTLLSPVYNWACLRAIPTLRTISFEICKFLEPPSLTIAEFCHSVVEHIVANNLGFAAVRFVTTNSTFLVSGDDFKLLLDLYAVSGTQLDDFAFGELCVDIVHLGRADLLKHPVIVKASQNVPGRKLKHISILPAASKRGVPLELFTAALELELRLREIRLKAGRKDSLEFFYETLANTLQQVDSKFHQLLIASFPFIPRVTLLDYYLFAGIRWAPQVIAIFDDLITDDAALSELFNERPGHQFDIMHKLARPTNISFDVWGVRLSLSIYVLPRRMALISLSFCRAVS